MRILTGNQIMHSWRTILITRPDVMQPAFHQAAQERGKSPRISWAWHDLSPSQSRSSMLERDI
jgi:hypothetical protein